MKSNNASEAPCGHVPLLTIATSQASLKLACTLLPSKVKGTIKIWSRNPFSIKLCNDAVDQLKEKKMEKP